MKNDGYDEPGKRGWRRGGTMKVTHRFFLFALLLSGMLLACRGEGAPQRASSETPPTVAVTPHSPTQTPAATATAAETAVAPGLISDGETAFLLQTLTTGRPEDATAAIDRIVVSGDQRFVAVFLELLRMRLVGVVRNVAFDDYIIALEALSGEKFGDDFDAWIEWYGATTLEPPPGFTNWKGLLLSLIDPGFALFLLGTHPSRIRVEEILWGGVRVDGIPALDNPTMIPAADAAYLQPENAVFGLSLNGDSRAYPLRILDWHEMANDVVGGIPVSLAYCTLCGAAIAYDGRASNGVTYDFGSSGLLYRSNKLMYDRQTRTLWNQLTGEPVLGELAATDVTLSLLPVVLTTWAEWQAQHPDTLVVDANTGYPRNYEAGAAYGGYFAAKETMFPVWQRSDILDTKEQIYALRLDGIPKAYPVPLLTAAQVVNDEVGATAVTLVATRGIIDVEGNNQYIGEVSYTAGAEVRAYARGEHTFAPGPDSDSVRDESGQLWQVTEEALLGPNGETAARLEGHLAFWFGWYAFFPQTEVYGQ